MNNKPLIIVVGGEVESEKMKVIADIKKNSDINFLEIINPEVSCHPKKQSLSAENFARHIAVKGQNVIMTTNSFHFLEAFLFYLKKYETYDNIQFYLVKGEKIIKSDNAYNVMNNLSQPIYDLADERFIYEINNEKEDDKNEIN